MMSAELTHQHITRSRTGLRRSLRSEWVKLRTVRSTAWSLLVFAGVSILFTTIACSETETQGGSPGVPGDEDVVLTSLQGIWFGLIAAAVLAVLAITSEYSTGTIRATFAADPRRRRVLAAKTAVVAAVVLAVAVATSVACFYVGQWLLHGNGFTYENGYPAASLRDSETLRAVLGSGVFVALLAMFALAVGAIIRRTAGAITLVLVLLLAPVVALGFLPERLGDYVEQSTLMPAGIAIQQTVDREGNIALGPWTGLGIVTAYAAASLIVALWLVARRDT